MHIYHVHTCLAVSDCIKNSRRHRVASDDVEDISSRAICSLLVSIWQQDIRGEATWIGVVVRNETVEVH